MVVCNFFLQGRCRYGEKCWNEHPRGGSRGGSYNENYRGSGQQQSRGGGGGFGNRVWVNPSQQRGGYIQPSSFSSQGNRDWNSGGGRGGDKRENLKSSEFMFSTQNRFTDFKSSNVINRVEGGDGAAGDEEDDKKLEVIQMDMDVWESSGQWSFSCYSYFKTPISGFTDFSPEELRLEYYSTRASGDLQSYLNGVNQFLSQWKSRIQELKIMSPSTRLALLAELNGKTPSGGFGSTASIGFGSSTSRFGNKGFGVPASSSAVFGSALAAPTQPPSGFEFSCKPSASTFSFTALTPDKPVAPSGFNFISAGPEVGDGFSGGAPPAAGGSSVLMQTGGGFGAVSAPKVRSLWGPSDSLFSTESNLTEEELNQFRAKRFTVGQIPLKPPPSNMLVV